MVTDYLIDALKDTSEESLNPYCNGRWSLTEQDIKDFAAEYAVLILIVMEDGH